MIKSQFNTVHIVNKDVILYGNYLVVMEIDIDGFRRYVHGNMGEIVVSIGIGQVCGSESSSTPIGRQDVHHQYHYKGKQCNMCHAMKTKGMVFRYTWVYSKEDTMAHTHRPVVTS